jgi:hypothetical protein
MERQLILDLFNGAMAVMVFSFLWVGLLIGRKSVNWENNHEGVAYIFMCLLVAVATAASCLFGAGTSDGVLPIKDCLTLADELGTRDLTA